LSAVAEDGSAEAVASFADVPAGIEAVAHRIVHGGPDFREPVLIDDDVERRLTALTDLAPLHQGPALRALAEARRGLPEVPHVAVFDTAFHATLPEVASTYALPRRWRDEWGVRRYGFHGLSVEWAAGRVSVPRLVVCHLGGGCSVTAVHQGRSVDTTMGFTPREGVPMATRSGSVDPGALSHVLRAGLVTAEELDWQLEHESGLLGLSGVSQDVQELERSDDPGARLALAVFSYRVAGVVAAMAAAMDGVDALVFTGGIGEHSARVRADVCERLGFLGIELDDDANSAARPDTDVAAAGSQVRIVVLRAREDLVAARAARELLASV
jgi:acetate kinase